MKTIFSTSAQWLTYLEGTKHFRIDLNLERMYSAVTRLGIHKKLLAKKRLITVAGTNGKGSTVYLLTNLLIDAGYQVGSYYSPHLFSFNERMQINGEAIDEQQLVRHLSNSSECLYEFNLTYFEFVTLVALTYFAESDLDYLVLEVGLGGRLDAVNVLDPDLAIISNIELDHTEWLGETREAIGAEKAGIMRRGVPTIYADSHCPESIMGRARDLQSPLMRLGSEFAMRTDKDGLNTLMMDNHSVSSINSGSFEINQVASVLVAYYQLEGFFPTICYENYFDNLTLHGRCQEVTKSGRHYLLDVAHNRASIARLAEYISSLQISGRIHAVFNMLQDKDLEKSLEVIKPFIDTWHLAPIAHVRGRTLADLEICFTSMGMPFTVYASASNALDDVKVQYQSGDLILVFGSFHLLSELGGVI